jgi:hypothetical protein
MTMKCYDVDLLAEVRRNREEMLAECGGIEGLHKKMEEERPALIKAGWVFATPEMVASKQARVERI